MRSLEFYEFVGIIAPGIVLIFGVLLSLFEIEILLRTELGASLLVLVFAYVAGHLVQGFGNLLEVMWWKCHGGMPTDWVKARSEPLLSVDQRNALLRAIREKYGYKDGFEREMSSRDWFLLVRSMYSEIESRQQTRRIDIFNGNYGLMRGVAVAFVLSGLFAIFWPEGKIVLGVGFLVLAALAVYRMHRFAKYYGREVFLKYLQVTNAS